mgnify:CR=1 FL=1
MGTHGTARPGGPEFANKITMPFGGPARPSVTAGLGVNPIHRGILTAVNMEAGLYHPPVEWLHRCGASVPELSLWLPRVLGML